MWDGLSAEVFKILKQERGIPCMMRRWSRSSSNAWMMESLLAGREPAYNTKYKET
jgi:hypothetical protein